MSEIVQWFENGSKKLNELLEKDYNGDIKLFLSQDFKNNIDISEILDAMYVFNIQNLENYDLIFVLGEDYVSMCQNYLNLLSLKDCFDKTLDKLKIYIGCTEPCDYPDTSQKHILQNCGFEYDENRNFTKTLFHKFNYEIFPYGDMNFQISKMIEIISMHMPARYLKICVITSSPITFARYMKNNYCLKQHDIYFHNIIKLGEHFIVQYSLGNPVFKYSKLEEILKFIK